jgi:hypothetical protein
VVFHFRTVTVRGVVYLRAEDVAEHLRELGATEETDTRRRLNEAAENVRKLSTQRGEEVGK